MNTKYAPKIELNAAIAAATQTHYFSINLLFPSKRSSGVTWVAQFSRSYRGRFEAIEVAVSVRHWLLSILYRTQTQSKNIEKHGSVDCTTSASVFCLRRSIRAICLGNKKSSHRRTKQADHGFRRRTFHFGASIEPPSRRECTCQCLRIYRLFKWVSRVFRAKETAVWCIPRLQFSTDCIAVVHR